MLYLNVNQQVNNEPEVQFLISSSNRYSEWHPKIISSVSEFRTLLKCKLSSLIVVVMSVLRSVMLLMLCSVAYYKVPWIDIGLCSFFCRSGRLNSATSRTPLTSLLKRFQLSRMLHTWLARPQQQHEAASCQGDESSMVIFCIDISSSMGGRVSCFLSSFGAHNFKPARYWGTTAYRWHNVTTRQLEKKM